MSNEVAIPQNVAPSGRLSKQLWSVAITTPTPSLVKLILMGYGACGPNSSLFDQFEQNCKVTASTMMIASTNGTSLILRQKLSVPIVSPRCSFLKRTARKW